MNVSTLEHYTPKITLLLREGCSGKTVKDIQAFLQQQDFYSGVLDGIYGAKTAAAITSFQRSHNLTDDGVVDAKTWVALLDAYTHASQRIRKSEDVLAAYDPNTALTLFYGVQGAAVQAIQIFLNEQNYYTGNIDGIYGSSTRAAVLAFQYSHADLDAHGNVDQKTWQALVDLATPQKQLTCVSGANSSQKIHSLRRKVAERNRRSTQPSTSVQPVSVQPVSVQIDYLHSCPA